MRGDAIELLISPRPQNVVDELRRIKSRSIVERFGIVPASEHLALALWPVDGEVAARAEQHDWRQTWVRDAMHALRWDVRFWAAVQVKLDPEPTTTRGIGALIAIGFDIQLLFSHARNLPGARSAAASSKSRAALAIFSAAVLRAAPGRTSAARSARTSWTKAIACHRREIASARCGDISSVEAFCRSVLRRSSLTPPPRVEGCDTM